MQPNDVVTWKIRYNEWLDAASHERPGLVALVARRTVESIKRSIGARPTLDHALTAITNAPTLLPAARSSRLSEVRSNLIAAEGLILTADLIFDGSDVAVSDPAVFAEVLAYEALERACDAMTQLGNDRLCYELRHAAQTSCRVAYWLTLAATGDDDVAMAAGLAERAVQLAALEGARQPGADLSA